MTTAPRPVETPTAKLARSRRWPWPDTRPPGNGETLSAWTSLGVGVLFIAVGAMSAIANTEPHLAAVNLVLGTTFLAMAVVSIARPGPVRQHVLIYRLVTFLLILPPVASLVVTWRTWP